MPIATIALIFAAILLFAATAVYFFNGVRWLVLGFFPVLAFKGGAPYVPCDNETVAHMVAMLAIRPGEKAVDIGAGDGRIVIALARAGAQAHGYEINPFLVAKANKEIKKAGLEGKAFMHRADFWKEDFSGYSAVALYCISYAMKPLGEKLQKELPSGARVASKHFVFPGWTPKESAHDVNLYVR